MANFRSVYEKIVYPLSNDNERDRMARYLKLFIGINAVAWIVVLFGNSPERNLYIVVGGNLLACVVLWLSIRAGKLTPARLGLPLLLVVSIAFSAASGAGVYDIKTSSFSIATLAAAFVFGIRGTIITFIASLGAYYYLSTLDVSRPEVRNNTPVDPLDQINFLVFYCTITFLIIVFFRAMRWDLRAALKSEAAAVDAITKLEESEARYRLLAQNATDVIWTLDLEGNTTYVSPSIEKLVGYTVDEQMPKTMIEQFTPTSANKALEALQTESALAHSPNADPERAITLELEFNHKNGGVIWGEVRATFLRDPDGTPVGLLGVTRNIDERKSAEAHARKLEAVAAQAHKLESVGVLAGGIAHDFNNLIMAIQSNIHVARNATSSESKTKDSLKVAFDACEDAVELSTRLLTFATGGDPVRETVNLRSAIPDAVGLAVSGKNISPKLDIDENLWAAHVDLGQIKQVLQNLAINAAQAMPLGGTLHVSAENVSSSDLFNLDGPHIHITIRDEGCGIEAEALKQIFDPFYTTKDEGSGLGLAISYSIIKHHGGQIFAQSEPGKGSTFRIYLPATEDETETGLEQVNTPLPGSGRILVMDDDPRVLEITGVLLEILEYDADLVINGEEAIAHYQAAQTAGKPYDGVLLDLTIREGMGGEETIKRLHDIDPHVKAIVASGNSQTPILANYQDYGFSAALPKPYKEADLSAALEKILPRA